ncbi:MAG TPA: sodium:solute symporter family protein, partial [Clostridiales bacterium]|nr:sodium:solute symporter family protein [Clostridiales bacterium]
KRGISITTFFAVLVAGGGYFIGSLCHRFYTMEQIAAFPPPPQDYIVPNMLKDSELPSVLVGIIFVLLLAASVSTLSSITLTATSTLSMDLIKGVFIKDLREKQLTNLTKALCVVFVALSYLVANTKTPILDMMSYSWGIISGSFLAPYVLALFWKKMNKLSAWVGILTGFFVAMPPAFAKLMLLSPKFGSPTLVSLAGKGPNYAVIAMVASLLACALVTVLSSNKSSDKENDEFYGVVAAK